MVKVINRKAGLLGTSGRKQKKGMTHTVIPLSNFYLSFYE
jgi:hypothetical protein